MITRLEIDGFKTFQQFGLDFEPLLVIVGPNAVGKSNLFDALRLLSRLADEYDLRTAFQGDIEATAEVMRGEATELFSIMPDGKSLSHMRFAVELLVARQTQDSWGAEEDLKHTRLRYELAIERRADERGLERLYVIHELLRPINRDQDTWGKRHFPKNRDAWLPPLKGGRKEAFISTTDQHGVTTIALHQDGHGGRKSSVAERIERTVLSGVTNTEFPHAFAAREEMRSWRFLQLNPRVLRQPSSMLAPQTIASDGNYLPSTLARLQAENSFILHDISRDLASLVPGITSVEVEEDQARNRYTVWAKTQDERRFSSRVLSDGTLRLLVLVTLKNDPEYHGVLCFEEPENGVHPFRLQNMVLLLKDLASQFVAEQAGEPLRQLLLNTHSPVLVNHLVRVQQDNGTQAGLFFAHTVTRVHPGVAAESLRITQVTPITLQPRLDLGVDRSEEAYSLDQVIRYLETSDTGETALYLRSAVTI